MTWTAQYDALLTPALAEAPVTLGTIDPLAERPDELVQPLGHVHARSRR